MYRVVLLLKGQLNSHTQSYLCVWRQVFGIGRSRAVFPAWTANLVDNQTVFQETEPQITAQVDRAVFGKGSSQKPHLRHKTKWPSE